MIQYKTWTVPEWLAAAADPDRGARCSRSNSCCASARVQGVVAEDYDPAKRREHLKPWIGYPRSS